MNKDPEKIPSLNRMAAELNKKYGEGTIMFLGKSNNTSIDRVPTGITVLDEAMGATKDKDGNIICSGMPLNRIVELYGIPSSGKSTTSLKTIAQAQKRGLTCIYVDAENAYDVDYAEKLGVDTKKLAIIQTSGAEDIFDILCKLIESEPGVIVVDSVAAMITTKEADESMEQALMAPKARLMSRGLAKINALNKKTLIIFINQLRSTLSMYGKPTTTTGGRALGHYASIRIEFKQGEKITKDGKKTGEVIGHIVNFRIDKNKTAAPYKQGSFEFYYETGETK